MINDKNTQYLVSNGLRLAYQDFGKPEDPVILLVAGLNNQMVRWPLALIDLLVNHGYRVIRFDNRDIGLSEKMEGIEAPGFFDYF